MKVFQLISLVVPFWSQLHALSELHLHLGGAWPLSYIEEIADPTSFTELTRSLGSIQRGELDYHSAFDAFNLINQIVDSDAKVEEGAFRLCEELYADGVDYCEVRTGLKDLGSGIEGYLEAIMRGIKKGCFGKPLDVKLLISLRRNTPQDLAEKSIDLALKYRGQGVVGIDISGDVTLGNGESIFPALLKAKVHGLPITLHLGESPKESAEQQMKELKLLQPKRVGHAVHLCEEGVQWVKEHRIAVELCLSSALMAGMIEKPIEHPALKWLLEGHPVAICTDDPLLFDCSLRQELDFVASTLNLNRIELEAKMARCVPYEFRYERDTMKTGFKAVIFDCDGTLIDSEEVHYDGWRQALQKWGYDLSESDYITYLGHSAESIAEKLAGVIGSDCASQLLSDKRAHYQEALIRGIPTFDATLEFLHMLAREKERSGIKIGLASAAQRANIEAHLKFHGLEKEFDLILSGKDDLKFYHDPKGVNKPQPYIYLEAAKQLHLHPHECVVIEDSSIGVQAARGAGCYVVGLPNRFTKHQDLSQATCTLDTLSGLDTSQFFNKLDKIKGGDHALRHD